MIAQVEHARKADRRVKVFVPARPSARRVEQIVDAALHGLRIAFAGRHQGQQRPRGLRRGAVLAFRAALPPVARAVLAPTVVRALTAFQPRDGAAYMRRL